MVVSKQPCYNNVYLLRFLFYNTVEVKLISMGSLLGKKWISRWRESKTSGDVTSTGMDKCEGFSRKNVYFNKSNYYPPYQE